ncbi:hypothetical protein B0T17DRAFT_472381, partial [Bombardia bombarda]
SSPISATASQQQNNNRLFKYAGRNTRPNPVVKRREETQNARRKLFLNNVRQRADDQKWERRGGENELLKLEWQRLERELQSAKDSDLEGFLPTIFANQHNRQSHQSPPDVDDLMLDEIEQHEEAEIDALLSILPDAQHASSSEPPQFSDDDEDYDSLFIDFLSQQQQHHQQQGLSQQDVEM